MRALITLAIASTFFNTAITVACETTLADSSMQEMNAKQATGALNRALLSIESNQGSLSNIDNIDCYLKSNKVLLPILANISPALTLLGRELSQAATREQSRLAIDKLNRLVARDAGTGFVVLPNSAKESSQINLYAQVIDTHCNSETTLICAQATELAKNLWWIAGEYRAFANNLNIHDKTSSLEFNERLEQQWQSYKNNTIKLWPQEVLLSSLSYRTSDQGLSAPPNYKLLALRPSIGLSYLSDQSHRVQPTINIDLLGIYWWQYGGDNGVAAKSGKGVSASLIWDGDDTAYGLTYHHNPKWSATLARGNENEVVISISFQLAHWLVAR